MAVKDFKQACALAINQLGLINAEIPERDRARLLKGGSSQFAFEKDAQGRYALCHIVLAPGEYFTAALLALGKMDGEAEAQRCKWANLLPIELNSESREDRPAPRP